MTFISSIRFQARPATLPPQPTKGPSARTQKLTDSEFVVARATQIINAISPAPIHLVEKKPIRDGHELTIHGVVYQLTQKGQHITVTIAKTQETFTLNPDSVVYESPRHRFECHAGQAHDKLAIHQTIQLARLLGQPGIPFTDSTTSRRMEMLEFV